MTCTITPTVDEAYVFGLVGSNTQTIVSFVRNNPEMHWAFLRGLLDGKGTISRTVSTGVVRCTIRAPVAHLCIELAEQIPAVYVIDDVVEYEGTNAIDFMGKCYEGSGKKDAEQYRKFVSCLHPYGLPVCNVSLVDPLAVMPAKVRMSDVGYDLTLIKVSKVFNNVTTLYDTGVKISVPHGYYAEVVPRSSMSKSGYMLANSIGIIDPSYRGNIFVALTKVDPNAPEVELPFRCCQIILRKQVFASMVKVDCLDDTSRNDGGFGSSGGALQN